MSADYILILTYHSDPGHGWVEVSQDLVNKLDILEKISEFSYYSFETKKYYLEEDCQSVEQGYKYVNLREYENA